MVKLLTELERRLKLEGPLRAYLAGGMAVHLYTGQRVTADVDIEFASRILVPTDLCVELLHDDRRLTLHIDTGYNPRFALLHADYQRDAIPVTLPLRHLDVRVLSPVDLAISKIARFVSQDQDDIAVLVRHGLTNAHAIATRGDEALAGYVGSVGRVRFNLRDAVALALDCHRATDSPRARTSSTRA